MPRHAKSVVPPLAPDKATFDPQREHEQLGRFQENLQAALGLPCDGFVLGRPVVVLAFEYDGNRRRGLTATCRTEDGSEHKVAAWEVVLPHPQGSVEGLAAYRTWLGLPPLSAPSLAPLRRPKATPSDLDLGGELELVVLAVKERAARCRLLGNERIVTLRAPRIWDLIPGEIAMIKPGKQWGYSGHRYVSGEILSTRIDAAALGLAPLRLTEVEPRKARRPKGPSALRSRKAWEMETVTPSISVGEDGAEALQDAIDLGHDGLFGEAQDVLNQICEADLRCLAAHVQLGAIAIKSFPRMAVRHFEVGYRIGAWSLGPEFDRFLPYELLGNRPFLWTMHGFGFCLWKLERFEDAERILGQLLRFDPSDPLAARTALEQVRARSPWNLDSLRESRTP